MSVQKPLFWQQGLFLQPQHFQLQEQSFRGLLAPFGRFAAPHFWGVGDLEIRKSALPNRILDLHRGTFMFPDGTWVDLPGNAVIRARSFDESWAGPLNVYLGLKAWNDSGENVTVVENLENISAVTTRFAATADPEEVNDLHAGGPVGRVKRLHYVLKLFWEHEIGEAGDYVLIPLARLAKAGAEVRVSEDHIPPSLSLAASETLTKLIVEIRDQITARGRQLEEYKKKRGVHSAEFGSRDMVYILALRSINRYVPLLHHCTETRDVHPWAVYGALRQLVGELSSFSERVNALGEWSDGRRVVPLYDHRDLWGCFATLQDLISHLLDEITAGPEYIIRLVHDGTSYAADLRPSRLRGAQPLLPRPPDGGKPAGRAAGRQDGREAGLAGGHARHRRARPARHRPGAAAPDAQGAPVPVEHPLLCRQPPQRDVGIGDEEPQRCPLLGQRAGRPGS